MPYQASGNTVRPFIVRRRRGLRGLGDAACNGNYTVTDQNGNNIPLPSLSGVALSQFLNVVSVAAGGYFCLPYGSISVKVNTAGGSGDLPTWTGYGANPNYRQAGAWQPMPAAIQKAGVTFQQFLNPSLLVNTTPAAGGVTASSLPANFQAAQTPPTQAEIAAAFPAVISSAAPPAGPGVPAGAASIVVASSSAGVPGWVWLLGGAAVLFFVLKGGK